MPWYLPHIRHAAILLSHERTQEMSEQNELPPPSANQHLKQLLTDSLSRILPLVDTTTVSGRDNLKKLILDFNIAALRSIEAHIRELKLTFGSKDEEEAALAAMDAAAGSVSEFVAIFVEMKEMKSRRMGFSQLGTFVRSRLPTGYLITADDEKWLDECDRFLTGPPTNESVVNATRQALSVNPSGHIDPYELLLDARICDSNCDPCP